MQRTKSSCSRKTYNTLYELKNINSDLLRTSDGGDAAGEPDELPPDFAAA